MKKSDNLAELVGIILGDGSFYIKNNSHYQLDIAFNLKEEKKHCDFVKSILKQLTKEHIYTKHDTDSNCIHLRLNSKKDVLDILSVSIVKNGDKIKNKVTIPDWLFEKESYLKSCVRGLIDTDGSVYRMSKRDHKLIRIEFKSKNRKLLNDVRKALILLNYHPSKVICNKEIFLSRQKEIERYINEIGFNNFKHIRRFNKIAPSSSGQETLLLKESLVRQLPLEQ